MHTTPAEGIQLARQLAEGLPKTDVKVIVAPPYTHLAGIIDATQHSAIEVAAQNCHFAEKGAFTGEVSIAMLKALGVDHVIIGHSERRDIFGESNALLRQKVDAVLAGNLGLIFCCGESLETRNKKEEQLFVRTQLEESLFHLSPEQMAQVIIAYEPIWAIGTGVTASPEQAQEMHAFIRTLLVESYGVDVAASTSVLYGGSVKPANAGALFSKADVDGGLVGGASLTAESFLQIIDST